MKGSLTDSSVKSSYQKHVYNFVNQTQEKSDVDKWITDTGCFVWLTESRTKNSTVDYYRCNQVSRLAAKSCPVRAKVERRDNDNLHRLYITTLNHHHPNPKSEKMSSNFINIIVDLSKNGTKPIQIHSYMKEKFGEQFHYDIEQVRYVLRKHHEENIEPVICVGDLISWASSMRKEPDDVDAPFVISMTHLNTKFDIVFSTLRLLSHAAQNGFCADTTYQTHWQGFPLNIAGCFDKMNQFHMLALSLSSNETTDNFAFLFEAVKNAALKYHNMIINPTYVMADAAFQISNGFRYAFPEAIGDEHNTLMCFFHVLKAINGFKFQNPASKEKVKIDIKVLQMCGNVTVFSHALRLFLAEWKADEPAFCEYFEREWIQKHPNWYAAANLTAPNTNNGVEGFNSSIKAVHTLRQRLVLTMFKETLMQMLRYKSSMYVREKEAKVFYAELNINRDDWRKAVLYATDPATKRKIFMHNSLYYILSDEEINKVEQRITSGESAAALFYSTDASSFGQYVKDYHQCVYELNLKENWMDSTCSCPYFMKNPVCKHIIAIAMLKRLVQCPVEANPTILSQKPKRGRKSNANGALNKPKN